MNYGGKKEKREMKKRDTFRLSVQTLPDPFVLHLHGSLCYGHSYSGLERGQGGRMLPVWVLTGGQRSLGHATLTIKFGKSIHGYSGGACDKL